MLSTAVHSFGSALMTVPFPNIFWHLTVLVAINEPLTKKHWEKKLKQVSEKNYLRSFLGADLSSFKLIYPTFGWREQVSREGRQVSREGRPASSEVMFPTISPPWELENFFPSFVFSFVDFLQSSFSIWRLPSRRGRTAGTYPGKGTRVPILPFPSSVLLLLLMWACVLGKGGNMLRWVGVSSLPYHYESDQKSVVCGKNRGVIN